MGDESVRNFYCAFVIIFEQQNSGNSDLEAPIAIRPTSETAMYPCMFNIHVINYPRKVIQSFFRLR